MKVNQEKRFAPITITIETIDELRTLFHRLNLNEVGFNTMYNRNSKYEPYQSQANEMWRALFRNDQFEEFIIS